MDIKVKGNREAQILAGIEPWDEATVPIDLSALSVELRQLIVEGVVPVLVEATSEAAIAALTTELSTRQEAVAEKLRKQVEKDAEINKWIMTATIVEAQSDTYIEGVKVTYPYYRGPYFYAGGGSDEVRKAQAIRETELKEEAAWLSEAAKAEAISAAQPQIDAAREAREAAEDSEKQRKIDALAAKQLRRAEIGAVEIEISRGNSREWGVPWGAVITATRGKDSYDFDAADYDLGSETLTIRCQPGDVIAWGQKNYRVPKKTSHERRKVAENWALKSA